MFVELTSETRYGGVDLHTGDLLGVSDLNHGGTVLLCTDMEGVHRKTRGLQGECGRRLDAANDDALSVENPNDGLD
jgi:hypothetical protein